MGSRDRWIGYGIERSPVQAPAPMGIPSSNCLILQFAKPSFLALSLCSAGSKRTHVSVNI